MEIPDDARVLVAVVTSQADMARIRNEGWYRIPLARAPQHLSAEYLAPYLTAACGEERWAVRCYAPILRYQVMSRLELLPEEPYHPRVHERYLRLTLGPLRALDVPVLARRLRRVSFIATSFGQLRRASDITDLWHPSEDAAPPADLWAAGIAGKSLTW